MAEHQDHCHVREGYPCTCGAEPARDASQLTEQVARAYIDMKQRVRELCAQTSRTVLHDTVRQLRETTPQHPRYEEWARMIEAEIGAQIAAERAREVFAKGGTAYCVAHDCDMRECQPEAHGD